MIRNKFRKKYIGYLLSNKWRKLRQIKAKEQNNTCEICSKVVVKGFHIHHKTYKHFGNEKLSELMFLCENCHKTIHANNQSKTDVKSKNCMYAKQYISIGTKNRTLVYCVKTNTKCKGACKKYKVKKTKSNKAKSNMLKFFCKKRLTKTK